MSVHLTENHLKTAEKFVNKIHANGGVPPLDVKKFWEQDAIAQRDPFAKDCPQVPLGISMHPECIFDELQIPQDFYSLEHDRPYVLKHSKTYNDLSEKIVGRRFFSERAFFPDRQWPEVKALHDIFEAKNVWHNESYWLTQSANTEEELAALLDRVEKRLENLRAFILPANWESEKARLTKLGEKVPLYRWQRGPTTFATSIFGSEPLIFLILDNPELAGRLRDVIQRAMLERARILDEEGGFTPDTSPRGFGFADDNCALMTPEMYEFFSFPIVKAMFDQYAPGENDWRYQHSDSAMGHLLPLLGKLKFRGVNFGPKLTVTEIREHLPNAVINGQLAPFTFARNEEVNIVAEFLRDYEMAREKKGLVFAAAGSINNGSKLTSLRLIMSAIQEFGQY